VKIELREVVKRFAEVVAVAGVSLEVRDGELFTLLGPSGCGKTTLLRLLAGFAAPDAGQIWFGDRRVDPLPAHARNIGMVFQNYALWPHMTVRANVTYGLRLRRLPAAEVESRLAAGLRKVNLSGLEDRYPGQLSGGQQQRVALARALVLNPDILLLDEPLSNLDAKIRVQVRAEIRTLQRELGITTVYVTHDQEEALSLSDRVAVMREGRVLQLAPPKELYERPVNRFVADFVGTNNFLAGTCRAVEGDALVVDTPLGVVRALRRDGLAAGARCVLAVRPENMALGRGRAPLGRGRAPGAADNAFSGTIALASYLGNTLRYDVDLPGGVRVKLDVRDPWHHDLLPAGAAVEVGFPASAALALPEE
jgi:ABC-type Fe3+/spermidine/putrescine transport system ATPase subunit